MASFAPGYSSPAPWRSRPTAQVRVGNSVELALSRAEGRPVSIDAFETGQIQAAHRGLKILAAVLLAPLWFPVLLILCGLMVIPSWIYIPYQTWKEWDDATSVGVKPGTMILNVVLIFLFGIVGGIVMTALLIGKVVRGNIVVLARTGDRIALLYQKIGMLNFPQFSAIEYYSIGDLSPAPGGTAKKIPLCLRTAGGVKTIIVRRFAEFLTGAPEINAANLRLLLGGQNEEAKKQDA